jgi:hypothetical protein
MNPPRKYSVDGEEEEQHHRTGELYTHSSKVPQLAPDLLTNMRRRYNSDNTGSSSRAGKPRGYQQPQQFPHHQNPRGGSRDSHDGPTGRSRLQSNISILNGEALAVANAREDPNLRTSGGGAGPERTLDPVLERYKTDKDPPSWELADIAGHVSEFAVDQHGSRFLQTKLETASDEEVAEVLNEVVAHALVLMTDVFGNYVVQKVVDRVGPEGRARVAEAMSGNVLQMSLEMYGCRVVQKVLEVLPVEDCVKLVSELEGHIVKCVHDQNGNHVVQKVIDIVPFEHLDSVLAELLPVVGMLSSHAFGCRVVQRILEHVANEGVRSAVLKEALEVRVRLF